jgi:hypothetical protein
VYQALLTNEITVGNPDLHEKPQLCWTIIQTPSVQMNPKGKKQERQFPFIGREANHPPKKMNFFKYCFSGRVWGRLEVGKFGVHVGCLGMGQSTLTWLGTTHAAPHSFIFGWEPPSTGLPWGSVGFKGTWKRKALSPMADSTCAHRAPFFWFTVLTW